MLFLDHEVFGCSFGSTRQKKHLGYSPCDIRNLLTGGLVDASRSGALRLIQIQKSETWRGKKRMHVPTL
jgi:hypothetical protein